MSIDVGYYCSTYPQETEIHSFTVKDTKLDTGHNPPAELVWALMDEFSEKLLIGKDFYGFDCFEMKFVYKRPGPQTTAGSDSKSWGVLALEVKVVRPKEE